MQCLREQAAEAGSNIEITLAAPVVGAWDRTRIEQVVTNLLSNAIKYGLGIPRADHSRIFQAFERLPTAERVGGLGLGLYIGRQIAVAHGGALTVESDPAGGTIFTLELPLEAPAG